jgi:hypothetical protein
MEEVHQISNQILRAHKNRRLASSEVWEAEEGLDWILKWLQVVQEVCYWCVRTCRHLVKEAARQILEAADLLAEKVP